jgi:hypothetical protein
MRRALSLTIGALALAALIVVCRSRSEPPSEPDGVRVEIRPENTARDTARDKTTLAVLHVKRGAIELIASADKPFPCPRARALEGRTARYQLEDAASGALLEEGPLDLPPLCDCSLGRDHADGCVVVPHEAIVRLKLRRLAARERLRLRGAGGEDLGAFLLTP